MRTIFLAACSGLTLVLAATATPGVAADRPEAEYRAWIEDMKSSDRGPFEHIRWFCNDGTVLPPEAYACTPHGGGHQHGEWSERTAELRASGYLVANLLAGVQPDALLDEPDFIDRYAQLLIERFLVSADDGWILRHALFYRGAIQEEDEREGARALLTELASRLEWIGPRFTALRVGVRMLPHGKDTASVQKVRQMSASLSDRDASFKPLRAKIHGAPGAEDAERVRNHAAGLPESQRGPYLELATEIDRIYQAAPLDQDLAALAGKYTAAPWLQELLTTAASSLREDGSSSNHFAVTGALLADLRDALPRVHSPAARLELLDLGLQVEAEHFRAAAALRPTLAAATRAERVARLRTAGRAAYGTGLVNARLLGELNEALDALDVFNLRLDQYLEELNYLGRVPGWGTQALRMYFFESMQKLAEIEPLAMLFIQDQLRGSPLLFFSQVLDGLSRDASRLAGVEHRLFDETVGVGFGLITPAISGSR